MNQFRILAKLQSDDAGHYEKMAEIIERGYVREYPSLAQTFSEELSDDVADEVYDILDMFRALSGGYAALKDKSGIDPGRILFQGFDGNTEGQHLGYASFLIHRRGNWPESRDAGSCPSSRGDLDSHCSALWRYRPMVSRWKESADRQHLTREEIARIIEM